MDSKPIGLVTFLFTDIEGSTKLSQEFPDTYSEAMDKHNSILTNAIESNNGFIFKIAGDSFCCAFAIAEDAVKAAVMAQKDFAFETAGQAVSDAVIKVRIGIHTGNAEWTGTDYIGYVALARVNRIMSAACGEQIIISNNTHELVIEKFTGVGKDSDTKITFRDLGERRLKDLIQALNLYQVVAPDLREDFPPLKTLDARPNNLPAQLTSFIGREKEMKDIKLHLLKSSLLTLLGPGGTGKTRLALQAGAEMIDDFENGVWLVELAAITEPSFVAGEIASVFNLKSAGSKEIIEILRNYLREKELLLILDNCEHLIHECASITDQLLHTCKKLKILTSSREPLQISGEIVYSVPSLSMPNTKVSLTAKALTQYESVQLFVDRATSVKSDFKVTNENAPALAQLCYDLDGIPLAIELASARINVLPVEKILERLKDMFNLLTRGNRTLLPRQQTLRALIDWSYDLLSEKEKILLQRVSIFTGGWTLEAAEAICSDEPLEELEILDLISNLINKSLVKMYESENESRYIMLETIRKYGEEKLSASKEKLNIQNKSFEFFYKFIEGSDTKLSGSEQRVWIRQINTEYENIRESLRWALENVPESALKMSIELGKFWELQSHFKEALETLGKCLENSLKVDPLSKAKGIFWKGFFSVQQAKYKEANECLNQSIGMFRELNYKEGEAMALISLATIAVFEVDYEKINLYSDQSLVLSGEINNRSYIARNLQNIAIGLMQQGKHDEARKKFEESIAIYRELNDPVQLAKIIGNIGALEYLMTNYDKARIVLEESLLIRHELGDKQGISIALVNIGAVAYMQKDYDNARRILEQSLVILKELGDRRIYVTPLSTLGTVAYETGDIPLAVKYLNESLIISHEVGDKYTMAKCFEGFADILIQLKKFESACKLTSKYFSLLESTQKNVIEGETIRVETMRASIKENLSDEEFEKLWSEGKTMTNEEGIEFVKNISEGGFN